MLEENITDRSFLRLNCVKLKVVQMENGTTSFNCSDVDLVQKIVRLILKLYLKYISSL